VLRLSLFAFVVAAAACGNVESTDSPDAATPESDAASGAVVDGSEPSAPRDGGMPDAAAGDYYISAAAATFFVSRVKERSRSRSSAAKAFTTPWR
jgi:hypothetical protein